MTADLERVRSRGFWEVRILPSDFIADRRSRLIELEHVIREANVQLRGWDYPHLPKEGFARSDMYIEGTVDWAHYLEVWRLYKSGQFVHVFAIEEDWFRDGGLAMLDFEPGTVIGIETILFTMTEIFLFASRLTEKFPLGPAVTVDVRIHGLANRRLMTFNRQRVQLSSHRRSDATAAKFVGEVSRPSQELLARHSEFALDLTLSVFELFHWDPARQNLADDQRRLLERRL